MLSDQQYLQRVLQLFNENQAHPELSMSERVLLGKVANVQKEVSELNEKAAALQEEMRKKQEEVNALAQQMVHKQGLSQGFVDSLLALRPEG